MEQEVNITIEGKQSRPGSPPEVIQTQARGTLEEQGGGDVVLTYREGEDTGLEGTVTTLRVNPQQVLLERTGAVSSRMVFEEGRAHRSSYATPYGTFDMEIRTRKLRCRLDSQGGEVTVYYDLELEQTGVARSMLRIQVWPAR